MNWNTDRNRMIGIGMDKIKIKNLEVFANHGVFPEETRLGQKFLVNAILYTKTREAGLEDDLTKSIHYGEVSKDITDFMQKNTYQLIEAAAERLAMELLLKYQRLRRIVLEIQKPWAPIGLPLESVSVEVDRSWHRVYLSFGSNMGERKAYIDQAVQALRDQKECRIRRISELLETKPYGGVEQDDFLNGCLEMDTLFTPRELLIRLHQIEAEAGRERIVRWGPRTLDLDILLYDRELIEEEDLIIPHVDMENRWFVLKPLSEIAPNLRHPISNKTVLQMLGELEKESEDS